MTYRENREARADRLREWSDKRAAKADAEHEQADRLASVIPFGQPILVGHHSEGRDRRYRARIGNTMDRAVADQRKAEAMASKAAEIDRQARAAIYDDDPDAVEQLRAKLARMEADRERMKVANAEYRKTNRAALAQMNGYEKQCALPHASYELQNLGGNITRTRQRIDRLAAREARTGTTAKPPRLLTLRYAGECVACHVELAAGTVAYYDRADRAVTCRPCQEVTP